MEGDAVELFILVNAVNDVIYNKKAHCRDAMGFFVVNK